MRFTSICYVLVQFVMKRLYNNAYLCTQKKSNGENDSTILCFMHSPHHRSHLVPMVLLVHHQETELNIRVP